jgi:IS5 family transposase
MVALLYFKHAFNESDNDVIQRWGETPTWQYFSGNEYFVHQWPSDPTQLVRFRKALGEAGLEELLARTIEVAVPLKLIKGTKGDALHAVLSAAGYNTAGCCG